MACCLLAPLTHLPHLIRQAARSFEHEREQWRSQNGALTAQITSLEAQLSQARTEATEAQTSTQQLSEALHGLEAQYQQMKVLQP